VGNGRNGIEEEIRKCESGEREECDRREMEGMR
jgi:hypothetical protein